MFINFFEKLAHILSVIIDDILPKLVPPRIITTGDIEEISKIARSNDKALFILKKIGSTLETGLTNNFYILLELMTEEWCSDDIKAIVNDIRTSLLTGELI